MALPIERWAKQAVLLERKGDYSQVPDKRIIDDVNDLAMLERQTWRERQRLLDEGGELVALNGIYAGLNALPPAGTLANVASLNGEAAQWATASWTPINANALMTPSIIDFAVMYQVVTSTSPASVTINPRLGSFASGASSTGGVQMGASSAITLTASITTNWYVRGKIWLRAIGLPGANSTAVGFFNSLSKEATTGNGVVGSNILFGYTAASFDSSIATGFVLGQANTVTTINYSTFGIQWSSWN